MIYVIYFKSTKEEDFMNKNHSGIWRGVARMSLVALSLLVLSGCPDGNEDPPEKTLVSLKVTTPPEKGNYVIGDALDINGLVLTATYSDNTTEVISVKSSMVSGFDSTSAGSKNVVITYDGKTATFTVTVAEPNPDPNPNPNPEKTLVSLEVTTPPTKGSYVIGEALNINGLVLTATYSDNTTAVIPVIPSMVSGFDSTSAGQKTVVITYDGKTATFTVTVAAESSGDLNVIIH
jgi:hypothetical protein